MSKRVRLILFLTAAALLVLLAGQYLRQSSIDVLQPAGQIGAQERGLIFFATILSLVIVVPVFVLIFFIAWKYREKNADSAYTPEWDHSRRLETIWWGVPLAIVIVLGIVTFQSSHSLDPFKPIVSDKRPLTIQVVALQWKWLFLYPDQKVATVNELTVPTGRPLNFKITSDAPMNSFWIPKLGGQIYAMSGMQTQLHLVSDKDGIYQGSSANISGEGFANMRFMVHSVPEDDFKAWVTELKSTQQSMLNKDEYARLSLPSKASNINYYGNFAPTIFDDAIAKYTNPTTDAATLGDTMSGMTTMHHNKVKGLSL